MSGNDPQPRVRRAAGPPAARRGFLARLFGRDDPDRTIRRLRRRMALLSVAVAVAVPLLGGTPRQALGTLAAGLLVTFDVGLLIGVTDRLLEQRKAAVGAARTALVAGRPVLLALGLYAIVLVPGVGPIPVALGLSVPVFAILLEAVLQLSGGDHHHS